MPRVPRYQQQARQSALPTPNVRVQTGGVFAAPGAALAQAGQVVQGVGQAVDQAQQRIQAARDKAAATLLTEREAELERVVNERLYTGKGALMLTAGRAAAEREPKVLEEIEALQTKLGDGLTGEAARAWNLRTGGKLQDIRRRTTGYVHQQLGVAREAAARLHEQQGLVTVANVWSDSQALETQIVAMESAAAAAEDVPEARALRVAGVRAKANAMAIQAAVGAMNWDWAQQRLELVGDALPPAARVQLQATVKTGLADRAAESKAAEIIASARKEGTGFVDQAKLADGLRGLSGEELKRTRDALANLAEAESQREKAVKSDHFERALAGVNSPGGIRIPPGVEVWMRENDPRGWDAIESKRRQRIESWRSRQRQTREPDPTPEQRRDLEDLQQDMLLNPDKFASMSARDFDVYLAGGEGASGRKYSLTGDQRDRAGRERIGAVKQHQSEEERATKIDAKEAAKAASAYATRAKRKAAVTEIALRAGLDPKKDKNKVEAFDVSMEKWVGGFLLANDQRYPTSIEWDAEALKKLTKVKAPLWGSNFAFEVGDDAATREPLPANEQPYAPVQAAMTTTIEEGLDLREPAVESAAGSFDLTAPTAADPRREAARRYLRGRGKPGTEAEVDALLDAAAPR